jgi:hypothetical protein
MPHLLARACGAGGRENVLDGLGGLTVFRRPVRARVTLDKRGSVRLGTRWNAFHSIVALVLPPHGLSARRVQWFGTRATACPRVGEDADDLILAAAVEARDAA